MIEVENNKILSDGLTKDVLKRWVKDYDLPIKIFDEPYFSYLVTLYKDYFQTEKKLNILKNTMVNFKDSDKFLTHNNNLTKEIVSTVVAIPEYQEFNIGKMDKFNIQTSYPKNDIYKQNNVDKYYVSIDLVKANFQALKYINPAIVLNCGDYTDFISKFTDYDYVKESKYIRQVIFGNLNPKRQIKVERFLIENIIQYLIKGNIIQADLIAMASSDEVVVEFSKDNALGLAKNYKDIQNSIKESVGVDVDIEIFVLKSIEGSYFVKEFINKEGYQFACVPQIYFPQIFKKYNGLDINDKDLVFKYEHQLVKFLNPIV